MDYDCQSDWLLGHGCSFFAHAKYQCPSHEKMFARQAKYEVANPFPFESSAYN